MMKRFWISKYALTQGIFGVDTDEPSSQLPNLLSVKQENTYPACYHGEGREWHREYGDAQKKANLMVQAKIKSLKKQLKKYEDMVF
jgi:hypothetical protein